MGICGRVAAKKLDFTVVHALLRLAFARRFIVYPNLFYDIPIFSDEKTCGYVFLLFILFLKSSIGKMRCSAIYFASLDNRD